MTKLRNERVVVACRNASGEADMLVTDVSLSQAAYELGEHYDIAESRAIGEGYEPPFLCFDESEQANIARQVTSLKAQIPFSLSDMDCDPPATPITGLIEFNPSGICLQLRGYSDCASQDDAGVVALIEQHQGEARALLYANINSEEPTTVASFAGARNDARTTGQVSATYISHWAEGCIETSCLVDLDTFGISEVESVETNHQYLEGESVVLKVLGKEISLEAEDGQLTSSGVEKLKMALRVT